MTNLESRIKNFFFFIESIDHNKDSLTPSYNTNNFLNQDSNVSGTGVKLGKVCIRGKIIMEANEECEEILKNM